MGQWSIVESRLSSYRRGSPSRPCFVPTVLMFRVWIEKRLEGVWMEVFIRTKFRQKPGIVSSDSFPRDLEEFRYSEEIPWDASVVHREVTTGRRSVHG